MDVQTVEATPMDCIVATCPYCDQEVIELNSDLRDMTGGDIQDDGEMECKNCGHKFNYVISSDY